MKITLKMLTDAGACPDEVEIFGRLFRDGGEVTEALAATALAAGLDLDWAARKFFTVPAWKAYKEATAPAFARCAAICDEVTAEQSA